MLAGDLPTRRNPRPGRILFLIVVVAFGLRAFGSWSQGLPYCFYPDEQNNVERALAMAARRDLDPHWFNKPALGYYTLLMEYGAYYLGGKVVGAWSEPEEFAQSYFHDPTVFFIIGRLSTALFGALTVFLTFRMVRSLDGLPDGESRVLALVAAAFLAVMPGHVASSQQVKMDVPSAFFTVWSAIFLLRIQIHGRWRDYILAGFLAGLGTATKYYSIAMLVPLLYVHVFRRPAAVSISPRMVLSPRLAMGVLALFGGFFIGSPYNFLNPMWFQQQLVPHVHWLARRLGLAVAFEPQGQRGFLVDPDATTFWDSLSFLNGSLTSVLGAGLALSLLAGWGVVRAIRHRRRSDVFLLLMCTWLLVFVAMASRQFPEPRHLCVLYPFIAVLAAQGLLGIAATASRLLARLSFSPRVVLVALSVGVMAMPFPHFPGRDVKDLAVERAARDPRLDAIDWLEQNIAGSKTIITHLQWELRTSTDRCRWIPGFMRRLVREGLTDAVMRDAQSRKAELKAKAAVSDPSPSWDVICWDNPWQTETLHARHRAAATYNPLWPRSPWGLLFGRVLRDEEQRDLARRSVGEPRIPFGAADAEREFRALVRAARPEEADLPPVEFWTRRTLVSEPWILSDEGHPDRTPSYFLAAQSTYENYESKHKRRHFPDWAAFYDDLKAHYDCWEFNGDDPEADRVLRLWDLTRRVEQGQVRRVR